MEQTQRNETTVVEDLSFSVTQFVDELKDSERRLTRKPAGSCLQNLQTAVYSIAAPVVHRAQPFERHMQSWSRFIAGDVSALDGKALRYLAWIPAVAFDARFLARVESFCTDLDGRILTGLVRSCHSGWDGLAPDNLAVETIRGLLQRYKGRDHVLLKWQGGSCAILRRNAPQVLAEELLRGGKDLHVFVREWHLEMQSPFFRRVVGIAAARCRNQISRLPGSLLLFLFRDILSWPGWEPSAFKKEVGALILQQPMTDHVKGIVERFILHHSELGDSRLRINRVKWSEVPKPAKDRFSQWLNRENPYVFSEHIYQQGKGWVWRQKASRFDPLSFEEDAWQ